LKIVQAQHPRRAAGSAGSQSFETPARNHPGHAIWKRNFSGASGLFSIVPKPQAVVDVLLYNLKLFGMGYSRGRVREPRHSVRLHGLPIHHQMGAGGTGSAASYPA
jgi:hypothetical protein